MLFCFHFLGTLSDPTAFYLGGEIHEKAIERCAGNQKAVQNRASTGKKLLSVSLDCLKAHGFISYFSLLCRLCTVGHHQDTTEGQFNRCPSYRSGKFQQLNGMKNENAVV